MQKTDLQLHNEIFEKATPEEILQWAFSTYGDSLVASSSFQTQSIPLLHILSKAIPDQPIFFVDTGFHFHETLAFRDQVVEMFNLNLKIVSPEHTQAEFKAEYGALYTVNADQCCFMNKVQPVYEFLQPYHAWISGIRADQTNKRRNASVVEYVPMYKLYKVNPMLRWTDDMVHAYIDEHNLPRHPLYERGFHSVGCAPCTRPAVIDDDQRSGRWAGRHKEECGMHFVGDTGTLTLIPPVEN